MSDLLWTLTLSTVVNHSVLLDRLSWIGPVKLHLFVTEFRKPKISWTGVGESRVCCGPRIHTWRCSSTRVH